MGLINSRVGCANGVSDDENWNLELLRVGWGEPFDGRNRPLIRSITVEAFFRMHPEKIHPPAHTQESRRFRLDLARVSRASRCVQIAGDVHVGVTSRVVFTMTSNTSLIVTLSSKRLSAPEMAAVA